MNRTSKAATALMLTNGPGRPVRAVWRPYEEWGEEGPEGQRES